MLNKIINFSVWTSVLNQLKNQQFMTCYSSLQFILLRMTISIPLNEKLAQQQRLYYNRSFSGFGTHLDDGPKILTCRRISPNIFCLQTVLLKQKSVKHRAIGSFWRRYRLIKKGWEDLGTSDMDRAKWVRQQLRTRMLWEFFLLYLPLFKVMSET